MWVLRDPTKCLSFTIQTCKNIKFYKQFMALDWCIAGGRGGGGGSGGSGGWRCGWGGGGAFQAVMWW